jgi:hypothetical protein
MRFLLKKLQQKQKHAIKKGAMGLNYNFPLRYFGLEPNQKLSFSKSVLTVLTTWLPAESEEAEFAFSSTAESIARIQGSASYLSATTQISHNMQY